MFYLKVIVIGYSVKRIDCELLCNGNHPAFSFTIFSVVNVGLQLLANCQRFGKQENMQNSNFKTTRAVCHNIYRDRVSQYSFKIS